MKDKVINRLKSVYDPEIPVDIYRLGLIYDIDFPTSDTVKIVMTLTNPGCPVAASLVNQIKDAVMLEPEISHVEIEIVWEPSWNQDMIAEEAKLVLDMY